MKRLKLSKTVEKFLNWQYYGNGKYYVLEKTYKGKYVKTEFANFYRKNSRFCRITGKGNDGRKKIDEYLIVEFSKEFIYFAKNFYNHKVAQQTLIRTVRN